MEWCFALKVEIVSYSQPAEYFGTQKEHIEVAKACALVISKVFPLTKDMGIDI